MQTERQTILACQQGSREAFGEIVTLHMRRAYLAALAILGNRDDAMDVSQQAFVKAYRAIRRFDPGRPFYPWFYRILRNACFDWLRRGRIRPKAGLLMDVPDSRFRPDVLAGRDEVRVAVWKAIGRLSEKDREIIVLRHFQHLSYQEIAVALQVPEGTVMSRLFTARKRLRGELDGLITPEDE
jgi:RNA polymerase sigma-70 factor (ECF subfamily)